MNVDNDGAGIGQVFQQVAVEMSNVSSALNAQDILQTGQFSMAIPRTLGIV